MSKYDAVNRLLNEEAMSLSAWHRNWLEPDDETFEAIEENLEQYYSVEDLYGPNCEDDFASDGSLAGGVIYIYSQEADEAGEENDKIKGKEFATSYCEFGIPIEKLYENKVLMKDIGLCSSVVLTRIVTEPGEDREIESCEGYIDSAYTKTDAVKEIIDGADHLEIYFSVNAIKKFNEGKIFECINAFGTSDEDELRVTFKYPEVKQDRYKNLTTDNKQAYSHVVTAAKQYISDL